MLRLPSAFIALILSTSIVFGQEPSQKIVTTDGFSISIPSDWIQLPKASLEEFARKISTLPGAEGQVYDYGFQPAANTQEFEYPYVLIQVKNTGRVREQELANLPKMERSLNEGADKVGGNLVSNAQIGQTTYDPADKMLFSFMTSQVAMVGETKAIVALKLTNKGIIGVYGYSMLDDFDAHAKQFEQIARSIELDESLVYKPQSLDSLPPVLKKALIGAVIGGVIGAVIMLLKKVFNFG